MAVKEEEASIYAMKSEGKTRSPLLQQLLQSSRKRSHSSDPNPDSSSLPCRSRTEMVPTTSKDVKIEVDEKPDANRNIRLLLSAPFAQKAVVQPTDQLEKPLLEPKPEPMADPIMAEKNPTIRGLLDLPRLDERIHAETEKTSDEFVMPRHDPADSSVITQLKLHLAYAFFEMARRRVVDAEDNEI
ncbi:unnamed protein product [Nippostrongylus brasiliensis]|uniref:Uncharacterized protein n=1 Tax=Nippostrongylus brasiliensis TaxID=27835 RepID=A0A0N4YW05_NIPBR|nr:unnamed protein product [Nippostrongylus brasiliensis]